MIFILIMLAPGLQIILSALRITGKLNLPIGVSAFLCAIVAFFLAMEAANIVFKQIVATAPYHRGSCGMPALACFIGSMTLDSLLIIIIGITCTVIYRNRNKRTLI